MRRGKEAGRSATAIYRDRLAQWKRRNRKAFVLTVGPLWVGTVVSCAIARPVDPWSLATGMLFGAAVVFTMVLSEFAPSHIRNWELGAMGEQATEKQLRRLKRSGWHVVHDRAGKFGNIDHIAVGPGGLFLIDSKRPVGVATVDGGRLVVRRREDVNDGYVNDRVAPAMKSLARWLHGELAHAGARPHWVEPVVALWCDFEGDAVTEAGVTFMHGSDLKRWLESRESILDATKVAVLAAALASLPAAPLPADPPPA